MTTAHSAALAVGQRVRTRVPFESDTRWAREYLDLAPGARGTVVEVNHAWDGVVAYNVMFEDSIARIPAWMASADLAAVEEPQIEAYRPV
jgi:predicted thioesterase